MGELTARFDLPLGGEAPKAARDTVSSVLWSWGFRDPDWLTQARVVVSELVSNAVVHGGCLAVDVRAHGEQVMIGAADDSAAVPRRAEPDEQGGRGLAVIEALSHRRGVQDHQGGKRVFVELLPPPTGR